MHRFKTCAALAMAALTMATGLAATPQAQARMRGNFDSADANHDGRVTLQEYETYAKSRLMTANAPIAQRFKMLTPRQQYDRIAQRFEKLDRERKGYLDRGDWNGS